MLLGLLILVLLSVNLGGIFSLSMQFGRGEWLGGLGSLVFLAGLDVLGFWLLRGLRSGE
ncbi:hypothetical protein [Deinococcus koreensis]|uniref:hypothetical protein n=1 Tax=Deinococcus koreensis TaxID=2054903 RepID=UPI0013FD5404|nr:hypothetical protein [Deinococcus koreensis]